MSSGDLVRAAARLAARSSTLEQRAWALAPISDATRRAHTSHAAETSEGGADDAIEAAKTRCERRWRELVQIYQQTHESERQGQAAAAPTDAAKRLAVLQARQRRYEAEMDQIAETAHFAGTPCTRPGPDVTSLRPSDPTALAVTVEQQIREAVEQLTETIAAMRAEAAQIEVDLASERLYLDEHEAIGAALSTKLAALREETLSSGRSSGSLSIADREVMQQIELLRRENRILLARLRAFVDTYYPAKAEDPAAPAKGKRKASDADPDAAPPLPAKVYNLKGMLEELLNAAVSTTGDPYLPLLPSYLPAYVELLLRAGIAVKHPRDPTRWKLVDFHL